MENPVDDYAMGVYDGSKLIGYVPSTPLSLNKTLFKIYNEFGIADISCEVLAEAHPSLQEWPEEDEDGPVIPCVYSIDTDPELKELIWRLLTDFIRVSKQNSGLISIARNDTEACRFFAKYDWCKFGDSCHFSHANLDGSADLPYQEQDLFDPEFFGFSEDDYTELLSQGFQPWNDDHDLMTRALSVLHSGEDYDDDVYSSVGPSPAKKPCFFFQDHGYCKYGADCCFSHDVPTGGATYTSPQQRNTKDIPCRFFLNDSCRYGDQCRFSHA
ncbi:hypothetical protein CAPTEDRAFT_193102 [Capitella teleta]|uniref:C3H1-type domain-containing protein n=1 Tax=Capitella teleta TaxID=283909 RepID=R7T706_CAPTE|nr:hypothetical protein CAPTEDRAFT_193102 [Capitella teleta]|eukprot:ELT89404.1 hypothetical protein CAPTEDRAFT_193102 [Capitella teleta]